MRQKYSKSTRFPTLSHISASCRQSSRYIYLIFITLSDILDRRQVDFDSRELTFARHTNIYA